MTTDYLVMQNHHLGISPRKFLDNKKSSSFFELLTTSKDENNKDYVSTVRSRNYPVTGFQWHPEVIDGWPYPTLVSPRRKGDFALYLDRGEARKSINRPPAQEVLDNLIYNYIPTYSGEAGRGFDQVYIFTRSFQFLGGGSSGH